MHLLIAADVRVVETAWCDAEFAVHDRRSSRRRHRSGRLLVRCKVSDLAW